MKPIDFFKLQAKNLHRDYKTQTSYFDSDVNDYRYKYSPKYFDIDGVFLDYDSDEENFSLMKAQHLIAKLAGFDKWTDLIKASNEELELAKLVYDNMHKISAEEWGSYISGQELENSTTFDTETKLEIFMKVFAEVDGHESLHGDYRLNRNQQNAEHVVKMEKPRAFKPVFKLLHFP